MTIASKDILMILLIFLGCCEFSKSSSHSNHEVRIPACIFKGAHATIEFCGEVPDLSCSNGDTINVSQLFFQDETRECKEPVVCNNCCKHFHQTSPLRFETLKTVCNNKSTCSIPANSYRKYNIYYHCVAANTSQAKPPPQLTTTTVKTSTASSLHSSLSTTTCTPTPTQTTEILHKTPSTIPIPTTATTTISNENNHGSANTQTQTDSGEFYIAAVAAPIAVIVVLAIVVLSVICFVKRRRQKNDGIYGKNDKNNSSNNVESVSNPAYTTEGSDNIFKHSKSVERTASSFSKDSGYAECKDVDTVDFNNGEYNTINVTQSIPNIDPDYSHVPKQAQMVDNTYSHITSDQNDQIVSSHYSHMDMDTRQPNTNVNQSTYNTLQSHAVNKPLARLPVNGEESENEYNHANFSTGPSKQDDNDTEYSHFNSSNNGRTRIFPTQTNSSPNDVEYAEVVENSNNRAINADNRA